MRLWLGRKTITPLSETAAEPGPAKARMAPLAASAKGIAQLPIEEDRGDEGEHGGGADEAAPTGARVTGGGGI